MDTSFKYRIIEAISQEPLYQTNSTQSQHTIRCPYCNDQYATKHGHFSILIDPESDSPILYRCLKCSSSGILSREILDDLGIDLPNDVMDNLKAFHRKIVKVNPYQDIPSDKISTPTFSPSFHNDRNLNYINNRLGTSFTLNECHRLRIVLNLYEFMKFNELSSIPNVSPKYLDLIQHNYVGFLSSNKNVLTLRRVNPNDKFNRYLKVILNPKNMNANTFYNIPNSFDLLYTNEIHVHITEGIFDILSVYHHLYQGNLNGHLYYACCGYSYLTIIRYLITNGINTNIHLHVYSDNDKTDNDHRRYLFQQSPYESWFQSIMIHRNRFVGEKDYGVPAERIYDQILYLKKE